MSSISIKFFKPNNFMFTKIIIFVSIILFKYFIPNNFIYFQDMELYEEFLRFKEFKEKTSMVQHEPSKKRSSEKVVKKKSTKQVQVELLYNLE